jgi:SARP family transcriptional regulator, regulator of embCAB operon
LLSREGSGRLTRGRLMGQWTKARIQLCGRFVADIDGSRIEDVLPGRIGRVLFAYLVLNRGRPLPRDKLLMAGWGEDAPAEAGNALSVQLSKLRHSLGAEHLRGRTEIELLLPLEACISPIDKMLSMRRLA